MMSAEDQRRRDSQSKLLDSIRDFFAPKSPRKIHVLPLRSSARLRPMVDGITIKMRAQVDRGPDTLALGLTDAELVVCGFVAWMSGKAVFQIELIERDTWKVVDRVWRTVPWESLEHALLSSAKRIID